MKDNEDIRLFRYLDKNGEFDYELYKECQIALNVAKIHYPGPPYMMMYSLCDNLVFKYKEDPIKFGICHGTRRGAEQEFLSIILGADILGTEISHTAEQFPRTIRWDFHDVKDEWLQKFDFIYSNSLDQSYDPVLAVTQWLKTLAPGGICIIHTHGAFSKEYISNDQNFGKENKNPKLGLPDSVPGHAGDPFVATTEGYKQVCLKAINDSEEFELFEDEESGRSVVVIMRKNNKGNKENE